MRSSTIRSAALCALVSLPQLACSDDGGTGDSQDGTETSSETTDSDTDPATMTDSAEGASESDSMTTVGDGDGDTTDSGDGDGDATATATTDSGDGDGDMTGDGDGDMTGDGDGDPPPPVLPAWIVSIDEPDATTDRLIRISIDDNDFGTVTEICADLTLPDSLPADTAFTSLTFNQNIILASARKNITGDTMVIIDPCGCEATEVGEYGFSRVNGITSNEDQSLFGVSVTEDVIIDIDPMTAASQVLTDLMADWGSTGLTWSQPQDNVLYGINASTDRLHTFDGDSGVDQDSIQLSGNFASVGIELHPTFNRLFACGIAGQRRALYEVNVEDGTVTQLEPDVWAGNCDNIAAPFGPVDCIPQ